MRFRSLLLLFLAASAGLRAQDPALRDSFLQAKALWATQGDRDGATAQFEHVLEVLAPKAAELDPAWTQVLCETYNWLAVLDDRNASTKARAVTRLQALIDLNPDFDVDRTLTSQRLASVFDRMKGEKLAQVKLTFSPEGGALMVDGKPAAALARKYLPFGTHKFAYSRPGFAPAETSVELAPRDIKPLDFKLTRLSSTVTVYVQPSGAEIFLDGKSLGHTKGKAGPEAMSVAVPEGLRPEDLSEGFVIADLKPGRHSLEVQAPCYKPRRLSMDESFATPFADHILQPVKLQPSRGTLNVTSAWPGGELFLSGQDRGPLPMKDLQTCAGTYDLMVRFPVGGYSKHLTLGEGETLNIEARPRPRLAFLGLDRSQDFIGRDRIQDLLNRLGERLQQLAFLPPRPGESPQDALKRLKASHEAELVLVAAPVQSPVIHEVELRLATLDGDEETSVVKPLEEDPLGPLVTRLNTLPPLQEARIDATLLDVPGQPGPWVLAAGEAAAKAGLQVHQPILQADGLTPRDLASFRQTLSQARERLTIQQAGGQPIELPVLHQALELPLASPRLSYPAVLAQLQLQYLGAKGEEANLLRLNIGLAQMHFRKYDKAIETLRDTHLGSGPGVNQGTLDYETGLCFLRLGLSYQAEAAQAFRQALKYPLATLLGPDGPLVAPLAQQALEELK